MLFNWKAAALLMVLALTLVFLLPGEPLEAATVEAENTVTIGDEEIIEDDVYLFGNTVNIRGTIVGDAFILANNANIEGTVEGGVFVLSETLNISGDVTGTIRAAANRILFEGSTERDLVVAANAISVGGTVGNDYLGAANRTVLTGIIGRDISAATNTLDLSGDVGGDIDVIVENLTIRSGAVVEGEIKYYSEYEAAVEDQAAIGPLTREDPPTERFRIRPARTFWSFVRPILSLLVVALLMALIFPRFTDGTAETIRKRPGASLGYGALVVFITPLISLFFLITIIGFPVSLLLMLLYIALICLTRVFTGYFLAALVFNRSGRKLHPVWTALIGVLALGLIIMIPIVGWIIHIGAVLFGAGAVMVFLFDKKGKAPSAQEATLVRTDEM